MHVRRYDTAAGDPEATLAVFRRAVRESASTHYDAAQVAAWSAVDADRWAEDRARRTTLVAEHARRVVGVVDVDPQGLIDVLFVDPEAGRRGVAGRLLEAITAEALLLGAHELRTHASLTARPVFERAGFSVVRRRRPHVRGQTFTNFEMVRALSGAACGAPRPPGAGSPWASGRS